MTDTVPVRLADLPVAAHRLTLIVPFTFEAQRANAQLAKRLDQTILAAALTLPAPIERASETAALHWRPYAGAYNDDPQHDEANRNPAYASLYPVAQQVVQNPLHGCAAEPRQADAQRWLCLPYSLPLSGSKMRAPGDDGGNAPGAEPAPHEAARIGLLDARLALFRTGIGLLLLTVQSARSDALSVERLLQLLRGLADPSNAPNNPYAALAKPLEQLALALLEQTLGRTATAYPQRKTWASAAHVPTANPAQLQRLAVMLSHRQTLAYALQAEHVRNLVYAPFAYTAHAASIGGAASVVSDDPDAKFFIGQFIHRVWAHTYLPLLLLPLHQHYFYVRHAEWDPIVIRSNRTLQTLEKRYAHVVELQAHFGSALVGQIDLHNAYVQMVEQRLRLGEREHEFERATRDYSDMLRAERLHKLRFFEAAGSGIAIFLLARELIDAVMVFGLPFFGLGAVPESREWFAQLQRWSPHQITEMIHRVHQWEMVNFIASATLGFIAAYFAHRYGRKIKPE